MQLNVADRLMLLNLLGSSEGDVTMLRVVRDAQKELGFSDEEVAALKFVQSEGQVRWDAEAAKEPVEIDLGKAAVRLIEEKLEAASAQKKLTLPQLDLFEKFVESPKEENDG